MVGNEAADALFDASDLRSAWQLLATSPAREQCASPLPVDLDGVARLGSTADAGAFEYTP